MHCKMVEIYDDFVMDVKKKIERRWKRCLPAEYVLGGRFCCEDGRSGSLLQRLTWSSDSSESRWNERYDGETTTCAHRSVAAPAAYNDAFSGFRASERPAAETRGVGRVGERRREAGRPTNDSPVPYSDLSGEQLGTSWLSRRCEVVPVNTPLIAAAPVVIPAQIMCTKLSHFD